jgi:hypothetical protein
MENFRRQQRRKEQQKQKEGRDKQRESQLQAVDTRPLFEELRRLVHLDKQGQLQDRPGQTKLRQLKDELDRLIDKRQKAGVEVADLQQEMRSIMQMKVGGSQQLPTSDVQGEEFEQSGGEDGKAAGVKRKAGDDLMIDLSAIPLPAGPSPTASYKPPLLPVQVSLDRLLPPLPVYPPPHLLPQQQQQQFQFYPPPGIAPSIKQPAVEQMAASVTSYTAPSAVVASAAPQIRDLRREAAVFVPTSVAARQRAPPPPQQARIHVADQKVEKAEVVEEDEDEINPSKQLAPLINLAPYAGNEDEDETDEI